MIDLAFSNIINVVFFVVCFVLLLKQKRYGMLVVISAFFAFNYMFRINTLVQMFYLGALILFIVLAIKKVMKTYIYVSVSLILGFAIGAMILISATSPIPIAQIQQMSESQLFALVIQYEDEEPYLYDLEHKKVITPEFKIEKFYPVYLKSYENHYIVIYSQNKQKSYASGFYHQNHLRDNPDEDHMMLIHKESGKVRLMYDVETVGRYIALNEIAISEKLIAVPLTFHHERLISFYSIYIIEDMLYSAWSRRSVLGFDVLEEPHITGHALSKDGLFLYTNSFGEVDIFRISYVITRTDNSISITYGLNNEVRNNLIEETYLIEGEYVVYDDIYFYGIDGNVYQIQLNGDLKLILEDVAREDWKQILDQNLLS
jgi:hypothetical protein